MDPKDIIFEYTFTNNQTFVGPNYTETFDIPYQKEEKKRFIAIKVNNSETNLTLELKT